MDENPYETPHTDSRQKQDWRGSRTWQITIGVLLVLAALPASAVAALTCCSVVNTQKGPEPSDLSVVVSSVCGLAVFAGVMVLGCRYLRDVPPRSE
jgi:hypothetical protein